MTVLAGILVTMLLAGVVGAVSAETHSDPSWLLLRRAEQAFRDREFGQAVRLYRSTLETRSPYPEAEAGLGMVFAEDGDLDLAERQYRIALQQSYAFESPEFRYLVLYNLAEIYELRGQHREYETTLLEIVQDDPQFDSEQHAEERAGYRASLLTGIPGISSGGLDRVLALYRQQEDFAREAHGQLGEFYLRTGRYGRALDHLVFGVLKVLSQAILELQAHDRTYRFNSVASLIEDSVEIQRIREYLLHAGIYRMLYHLAEAAYAEDTASPASTEIWKVVAEAPDAGEWGFRSRQRLRSSG